MPPGGYHFIRVPRNRHAGQRTRQVTWKSDAGLIMALLDFFNTFGVKFRITPLHLLNVFRQKRLRT